MKKPQIYTILAVLFLGLSAFYCRGAEISDKKPVINSFVLSEDTVGWRDKIEIDVIFSAEIQNPFDYDENLVYAELTSPENKTVIAEGFLYNIRKSELPEKYLWKIRFAPDKKGRWKGIVKIKNRWGETNSDSFFFQCSESQNKGNIIVSPKDSSYFEFENREFFFPIGHNIGWASASGYKKYFRKMSENGENWARIWMCPWNLGLEWTGEGFEGLKRYNLKRASSLDKIIDYAREKDIYIQLVLNNHGQFSKITDPEWDKNPYNAANGGPCLEPGDFFSDENPQNIFKNRLRYIIARWGYSKNLMAWELFNEVSYITGFDIETDTQWHKEISSFIKQKDAHNHLITTSYGSRVNIDTFKLENIDFSQVHTYTNNITTIIDTEYERFSKLGKPFFFGEFGSKLMTRKHDPEGSILHSALWTGMTTPSSGTVMSWWWDSYIQPLDLYEYFKCISKFIKETDFRVENFESRKAFIKDSGGNNLKIRAIANDRKIYCWIYNPDTEVFGSENKTDKTEYKGVQFTVKGLCKGSYKTDYWNTFTGEIVGQDTIDSEDGSLTVGVPDFKGNIALKIIAFKILSKSSASPEIISTRQPDRKETPKKKFLCEELNGRISIDGNIADWIKEGYRDELLGTVSKESGCYQSEGMIKDFIDCSARFLVKHDRDNLYFLVVVTDNEICGQSSRASIWKNDCVEIWLDAKNNASFINNMPYNPNCFQINISPIVNGKEHPSIWIYRNDNASELKKQIKFFSKIIASDSGSGFLAEVKIPVSALGIAPLEKNQILGFNLSVSDVDTSKNWSHMLWNGTKEDDATEWGQLIIK
ncbi:MAG: sugar-binding protein [bacterium]|nr:sugar-binding protein [bacterium]